MKDLICQVIQALIPRYRLCGSDEFRIGAQYKPETGIINVIGMYNAGVVLANYTWSNNKKTYVNGSAKFYALTYQTCLIVASIYPLNDDIGQGFVNNTSTYTPSINDFTSTIPTEAITYRECKCKITGVFNMLASSDTITAKKYVYSRCNFKVYITETIFPTSSGQALNGDGTSIETWRRY